MGNNAYQLIINTFAVGTWLQTLLFYFLLFFMLHIVLVQLDLSFTKWRFNFIQRWLEGRLQK
jgi:hypothetical protein